MRRDLIFITLIISVILILFGGIFIRGIKTESIAENRKLEAFPTFSVGSFFDANYQATVESALTDQLVFSEESKSLYNNLKNNSMDLVVFALQSTKAKEETTTTEIPIDKKIDAKSQEEIITSKTLNNYLPFIDKDIYTNLERPSSKLESLPMVVQKELAPKPTIIIREPQYTSFTMDLKPRGSSLFELVDSHHLFYPKKTVSEGRYLMEAKADNYNRTVANYPDIDFFSYYIESDFDIDFVNGEISHDIVESFFELLDPRIKTSALYVNNVEEYQTYFYKTDHHWDVEGQLQGYKDIIGLLKGEYEPLLEIEIMPIDDLKYNGYKSRAINDYSIKDDFKILVADLPNYTTYINYKERPYGNKEDYLAGNYSTTTGINHYRDCNGVDYGIVEYDFNQPEKENLLLYVESFSNPINAFIASHYNKTYFVDYRHYQPTPGNSLDFGNFVNEHEIDDVLFMGYYLFYANYMFKVSD